VIGTLSDAVPSAIPGLVTLLLDSRLPESNGELATPGYTFGATTIRGRGTSTELGFRLMDIGRALDVIRHVAESFHFGGLVALRYVKPSFGLLAFTRFAPTCTVEIQAVDTARTAEAYRRIWEGLDAAVILYTCHWGQALPLDPAPYARVYGDSLRRWKAARARFLSPAGRRLFSSPLLSAVGLD
jgi:hypothetical protein